MSETLSTAFLVLLVGMTTVFAILSLVVLTGTVLIRFVNRFVPEASLSTGASGNSLNKSPQEVSPEKMAAIIAATNFLTLGKGKITKIERSKK